MQVRHYMTAAAAVTHPDEPVVAAARLMRQRSIGALPVCEDDGTLAGMLTDRDIVVRCVSAGDDPQTATVRGIMSRDPVTIEADADVRTAMTAMRAAQVSSRSTTSPAPASGTWSARRRCAASRETSAAGEAAHRASDAHPGLLLEEKALIGIGCGCVPAPPPCAYAQVFFLPAAQTPRGRLFSRISVHRAQIAHKRQSTAQKTQQSAQS
mgnify:CR=1 FL=1